MQKVLVRLGVSLILAGTVGLGAPVFAKDDEITLIHTGDFHGHLVPRQNVRSDGTGRMEGGLARIYRKIQQIRSDKENVLLLHTGDTIQGSAEVLYTRGQAIVDVVNLFGIDAYAPGNWEFVYGTERFLELFVGPEAKAPWNAIAANVYYSTLKEDPGTLFPPDKHGKRVTPPYLIKEVGGIKVGLLGFTTDRGPQVVGTKVTQGFKFTKGDIEVEQLVPHLRNVEKVDVVIMMSELGLANNIRLAEKFPGIGIDVILSSDMHEETRQPVVVTDPATGAETVIIEEGQDGTMIGEIRLKIKNGRMTAWKWKAHNITDKIHEDQRIAAKVGEVRKAFVSGPDFVEHFNPLNGAKLRRPIDTVIGYTAIPLHRSNFSHEEMPAVIEGSSHAFLTDAFRAMTGADIGALRGFRYGTHIVAGGSIKLEDLYHFIPIGPQIAIGEITGGQLKSQIANAADGALNPDVSKWTGGWLFNFSGVTMDIDPYLLPGQLPAARVSNIQVNGMPLDDARTYTYASYWYANDPTLINVLPAKNIRLVKDDNGDPMDGADVVARYLESLPGRTANPQVNRIRLLQPLPPSPAGFYVMQPLRGATLTPAPIHTAKKGGIHRAADDNDSDDGQRQD